MPDDSDDRLESIKRDLKYFRAAHANMGIGGQAPMVYAAKYADDVGYLLGLLDEDEVADVKSQLEIDLEHDKAVRAERRTR